MKKIFSTVQSRWTPIAYLCDVIPGKVCAKNWNKVYSMNRYLLSVIILTAMMSGQIMSGKSAVCRPLLAYFPQWLSKWYAQSGDSMKKNFSSTVQPRWTPITYICSVIHCAHNADYFKCQRIYTSSANEYISSADDDSFNRERSKKIIQPYCWYIANIWFESKELKQSI